MFLKKYGGSSATACAPASSASLAVRIVSGSETIVAPATTVIPRAAAATAAISRRRSSSPTDGPSPLVPSVSTPSIPKPRSHSRWPATHSRSSSAPLRVNGVTCATIRPSRLSVIVASAPQRSGAAPAFRLRSTYSPQQR